MIPKIIEKLNPQWILIHCGFILKSTADLKFQIHSGFEIVEVYSERNCRLFSEILGLSNKSKRKGLPSNGTPFWDGQLLRSFRSLLFIPMLRILLKANKDCKKIKQLPRNENKNALNNQTERSSEMEEGLTFLPFFHA